MTTTKAPAARPTKRAKRTATSSKPTVSAKQSLVEQSQLAIAERIVAGYALLSDIDLRVETIDTMVKLSLVEELQLKEAFPDVDSRHKLVTLLNRTRRARELREAGASLEVMEQTKKRLADARSVLAEATCDVESIDQGTGTLIAQHLARLQEQIDGLTAEVADAERAHETATRKYDTLMGLAPTVLIEHTARLVNGSMVPTLKGKISKIEMAIGQLKNQLRLLSSLGKEDHGSSAKFYPELTGWFPEGVVDSASGKDRTIDLDACQSRAREIEGGELGELEEQATVLRAELAREEHSCNALLHEWAKDGRLTTEMILGR